MNQEWWIERKKEHTLLHRHRIVSVVIWLALIWLLHLHMRRPDVEISIIINDDIQYTLAIAS